MECSYRAPCVYTMYSSFTCCVCMCVHSNLDVRVHYFQAIKRKLDDIGKKLAILYDLLRESKVATATYVYVACRLTQSLHLVQPQLSPDVLQGLYYISQGNVVVKNNGYAQELP